MVNARSHLPHVVAVGLSLLAMVATFTVAEPDRPAHGAEPGVDKVYIARAFVFADALAGSVAAALNGAPILLVPGGDDDTIPDVVRAELIRLDPQEIVVLGGPAAISPEVENQLDDLTDGPVSRLEGLTRFGTAVDISRIVPSKVADADNLDGQDSSQFLGAGEKATDADLLDGMDATDFAAAPATVTRTARCVGDDFQPTNTATSFVREVDLALTSNEDGRSFRCVVKLPDGATITGFRFDAKDDFSTSGVSSIDLAARGMEAGVTFGFTLASLSDTGVTATHGEHFVQETMAINDTDATTVSDSYAYLIDFSVEVPSGTARVGVNSAEVIYDTVAVPGAAS